MVPRWVHNSERIRKPNLLFPDSYDFVAGDEFYYEGEPIEVEIVGSVLDVLVRGGVFKKPDKKVYDWSIDFDNNLESSIRSDWGPNGGCFNADSCWTATRSGCGVAVFGKTSQRVKIKTVTVPKRAYETDVAARNAAQRELEDLRAKLAAAKKALSV